ncbi:transcription elongation factor GreA [Salinispira pacifica]
MSEKLLDSISELLNEEKWTRATLNNYTVGNFKELDKILDQVFENEVEDEVVQLCDEHLQHTKNSIIALYISGILNLSRQTVDDTNLIMLISIFTDNHKWNIVEYLCQRILEFGENKSALRTLAECYNNENQPERMYEVWERLIRVDYEEADIVKHLAEKKEKDEAVEEAVNYYKKALHRYINKKVFTAIKEIWGKLIQLAPEETEFFYHAEGKIAKAISEDRAVQLLTDLYPYFREKEQWDTAIGLLQRILDYDPKNSWARKEITECFRAKYAHHSQLEEYIKLSNLTQSWRNVHDAIGDFEKHISFDAGNFVFHRSWGVGLIRGIKDDEIRIDFVKKRGHTMSLKMAVNALTILPKDHIWVLKTTWKKDKLHNKVKEDPAWALKIVIRSYDNAADMKKIKAELVPSVLTASEWSSWSTRAREVLKTDESFGNLPDKLDNYVVRDQPISFEEKTFNKFKAEKSFFDRVKTLEELLHYIEKDDNPDPDTDFFREMLDYFTGFLKSYAQVNEQVVASFLIVRKVTADYPYLNPGVALNFRELYNQIGNVEEIFSKIDNSDLKRDFLTQIRKVDKNWQEVYVRLFPYFLSKDIIGELFRAGHKDKLSELFHSALGSYRESREAFVWIARNCMDDEWFRELSVDYEKILIAMIHLLDLTFRDISNRKDVSANRKVNKQIQGFLFKDDHLPRFVNRADEESLTRIYTLVDDVKELDPAVKLELRHKILERFPDFKFYGGEKGKEAVSRASFYVIAASYEAKQRSLVHMQQVEVPANSKEIGAAREYGDLRENAEFKAAKERQEILNTSIGKLTEELDRAQVISPNDVDTSRISYGTTVSLKNLDSKKVEEYTIMGPWESNPNEAVISYLSPFGNELYGAAAGDELNFIINERPYNYRVESISLADFDRISAQVRSMEEVEKTPAR